MSTNIRPPRDRSRVGASLSSRDNALDESLAAWLGWFSSEPLPDDMAALVDQLEAAYAKSQVLGLDA